MKESRSVETGKLPEKLRHINVTYSEAHAVDDNNAMAPNGQGSRGAEGRSRSVRYRNPPENPEILRISTFPQKKKKKENAALVPIEGLCITAIELAASCTSFSTISGSVRDGR